MAYKNQKKNKIHQKDIRRINNAKKRLRKSSKKRFMSPTPSENEYLMMMRQQGLI